MTEYAVEAERLGKRYDLYATPARRVLEWLTLGRFSGHSELWALCDLDLRVPRGAVLGLCGANGSGKSTLLKVLSRTTTPTAGRFRTVGRVLSLLELGIGVELALTGRENVVRQALMHGYSRREIVPRLDAIVEFSELGGHVDEPVRTYSSGMAMRLAFSAAALMDPDVLILDEVLAVGDVSFQKKCIERIRAIKQAGTTILFCSHSIYDLRQLCDEALWLRDGRCAGLGDVVDVTAAYFYSQTGSGLAAPERPVAPAKGTPRIQGLELVDGNGAVVSAGAWTGDDLAVRVSIESPNGFEDGLHLAIGFRREDGVLCAGVSTLADGRPTVNASGVVILRLPKLALLSGTYLIDAWLLDRTGVCRYHEFVWEQKLVVRDRSGTLGVYLPERSWE